MPADAFSPVATARRLVREALKGALATLDAGSGAPYASLVTLATEADGTPVMLLSDLALHARNLKADPRASILYEDAAPGTDAAGDPLTGARVTVTGRVERVAREADAALRRRFLARQPDAAFYADFRDFAFYRLVPGTSHLVAGFGRIVDIRGEDLLLGLDGAEEVVAAEAEILDHLNEDHAATLDLYAVQLLAAPSGPWRAVGCDPGGLDLLCKTEDRILARRLDFPRTIRHLGPLRATLHDLAVNSRGKSDS